MTGYPTCLFLTSPHEKFLCKKCRQVLREPVQTLCGNRYCETCFQDMTKEDAGKNRGCNACKEEGIENSFNCLDKMYNDRAIRRELNEQEVRCANEGCDWTGFFNQYQQHITSCPFETINCIKAGCNKTFPREKLADHLENECAMRVLACPHCDEMITHADEEDHLRECGYYPVPCQFCETTLPRQQIKLHTDPRDGDCEKKVTFCEFREVGCLETAEKDKMAEHSRRSIGSHLLLLLKTIIPFLGMVKVMENNAGDVQELKSSVAHQGKKISEIEDNRKKLEHTLEEVMTLKENYRDAPGRQHEQNNEVGILQKVVEELKNSFVVLSTKMSTSDGVIAVLNNQIEKATEMVQSLQKQRRKDKEIIESLERKVKAQDRIIATKDVAMAEQDIRIQALEMSSYDGVLVWKISDFTRKRNDAISGRTTSIYSPCFHSSRHGYKMCARVYLNGDGMGKGNHVSLFFVIMKGPFDALLRWPFRQKVTFMWLDQNNREHVIDAFRPDPTSNSFQRPKNDLNIASGCPLFLPLSTLESPRHAYVKDDVAFIKIFVDVTDLI